MGFIHLKNDKGELVRVHTSELANAQKAPVTPPEQPAETNLVTPTKCSVEQTAVMQLEEVITSFEFDSFGGEARRIEVRQSTAGHIRIVHCGDEESEMFGATVDQWGTWYNNDQETIAAQEFDTRSFLDALTKALVVLRATCEVTIPSTTLKDHPALHHLEAGKDNARILNMLEGTSIHDDNFRRDYWLFNVNEIESGFEDDDETATAQEVKG